MKHLLISLLFLASFTQSFATSSTLISNISVTTSNTISTSSSNNIIDNDFETGWNSGQKAEQWVILDLKDSYTINKLILITAQSTTGRTVHKISGGLTPDTLKHIITLDQITTTKQTINIPLLIPVSDIRYLKITTTSSPSNVAWKEIQVYKGAKKVDQHLKYFGYLSSEGLGRSTLTSQYFSELKNLNNSNIAWVYGKKSDLQKFKDNNLQAIVRYPVTDIFFTGRDLNPNWQTLWQDFKNDIAGYEANIWGFEIDEPLIGKVKRDAFRTATQAIRQSYPTKAMFVIEGITPIVEETIPPDYYEFVTDIGFDYYFTRLGGSNDINWGRYLEIYEKFKPYIKGKKYWLIPDGLSDPKQVPKWPDAFERYLSLAITTDNSVGILPFVYNRATSPTITPPPGSERFISLQKTLIPGEQYYNSAFRTRNVQVGQAIIANNQNTSILGDANNDGIVDLTDFGIWKYEFLVDTGSMRSNFNKNDTIDLDDFQIWKREYLK